MSTWLESTVVGRSLPFQRTTELGTKLSPTTANWLSTESTNCSPAGAQLGDRKLIVGTVLALLVTVKLIAFEVAPPGAGLVTVTADVPAETTLEAGMAAVNCVELTNVVGIAPPPKLTIEDATKFVPLIVSVNAAPPAAALFGEIVVIVGVGLAVEAVPPPPPQLDVSMSKPRPSREPIVTLQVCIKSPRR